MKPKAALRHFLALAGSSLLAVSSASAQSTYTWANSNVTNTPTTLDWFTGGSNTQATWTGGTPASSNLNTIQFFTNTATAVPNTTTVTQGSYLNNGGNAFQLGTLTFSGQAPAPANQDLTMNVGGDAFNFSGTTGTINLDSVDISGNSRNITWNVSNAIQLGTASSASTLTLAGNGSSTFNFSGGFTELQAGGGSTLVKSGTSLTTLSGAVTVSGGLEVNAGTLRLINASNAITGGITLNGGTLGDNNGRITTQTLNNNLITVNGAANLGMEGGTTTNGGITLNSGANLTLATNASSATVNGAVTGVGSISIGQLGGGGHTQNLNSTANTFTGTISFTAATHAATLNINSLADSASLGAGNIRFVGSAGTNAHTFALGSGAIAPVTLNNRQIEIVSGSAAAYTIANNSSQAFTINTDLLVGATGARTLTLGGTGTGLSTFGGKIEDGSGTVSITKAGTGTWLFSGNNTYTGSTSVSAGTLQFAKVNSLYNGNTASWTAANIRVANGGTLAFNVGGTGEFTSTDVGTLFTNLADSSNATTNGMAAGSRFGFDTTNASGGSFDISQVIANSGGTAGGARGLTKLGTGTLVLSNANTYTGVTTISGGILSVGTIGNGGVAGNLGQATNAAGNIVFNGGTLQYTGANATSDRAFTINAGITATIDTANNISFAGATGAATTGALTKTGAGTLTLTGTSTYSGATTVNGGELHWGVANAIAAGALNVNDGGTVNMQTFSDTVGTVTIAKGGTITGTTGILTTGSGGLVSNGGGTISGFTTGFVQLATNAGITYNGGAGSTTFQISRLSASDAGGPHVLDIADGEADVDFELTSLISNGNTVKNIIKTGSGVMQFSGDQPHVQTNGTTNFNIANGTVLLNKADGVLSLSGSFASYTVGDGIGAAGSAVFKFASTGGNNQIGGTPITINSDGLFDLNGKTQSSTSAVTVNSTGQMDFNGGALSVGAVNIVGTGAGANTTAIKNTSGTGSLTVASLAITPDAGYTSTVSLGASGTLILGGDVTFNAAGSGRAQITGSELSLGAANRTFNIGLGSGADYDLLVSAGISGSSRSITKSGLGRLTLSGSNSFTGSTTLNSGTLKLDYSTNNDSKLSNTASIGTLLLNGGTLELSGGSHVETVLSTTLNNGTTLIRQTGGGSSTLSMGAITFNGGAIDFSADNIATTTNTVTNGILSQRATVAGANFAMKSGSNIVAYDYASSGVTGYTGAAMVANTNYQLTANGASTLSGTTGATSNTLKIANTATGSLAVGANTLTIGAILFAGSANYDLTTSGAGSIIPSILHNYGTGGAVLNIGALGGNLTQFGTGKTVLNNAATTNSTLNINGGTVQISDNLQIGTNSGVVAITLNNGTLLADTTVGGIALNNGGLNSRTVTLGAGGGTLDVIGGNTLTVSGVISGANPLLIGSASTNGTIQLTATNTNSVGTTINGGTLSLGHATNTLADAGAVNINNGGTLSIGANSDTVGTVTIAKGGTITGTSGALTVSSIASNNGGTINGFTTGALILTGNLTYNDTISDSTTLTVNRLDIRSGTTFNIARGDDASGVDFDITGEIFSNTNGRNIIKSGSGVMRLSGSVASGTSGGLSNGTLSIQDGSLIFNKSAAVNAFGGSGLFTIGDSTGLANSAVLRYETSSNQLGDNAITINSDGLFNLNGLSETTSGALTMNGGSITTGAGTLTLGAATNTISGASTVTGNLTLSGTAVTNLTLGGTASINGTTTFSGSNGAGITATGNTSIVGTLAFGSGTRSISVTNASDVLTISATTSGTGVLTKSGAGTLIATAASALPQYTTSGRVVINGGTLGVRVGGSGWTTGQVDTLLANATKTSGALGIDTTNGSLTQWTAFTTTNLGSTLGLTKLGTNTLTLNQANTYTGATTVSAGTLYVTGSLASSQVIVKADGTIGSSGGAGSRILGNGLTIEAGGNLDFTGASLGLNSSDILSLTGGSLTLGNLTFQDIVGWDWANAAPGTYELINGSFTINWGSTAYLDPATAYDFGNGNKGYFTAGSLNAVIVAIPEPGAALLGGLGILLMLRRRR